MVIFHFLGQPKKMKDLKLPATAQSGNRASKLGIMSVASLDYTRLSARFCALISRSTFCPLPALSLS